LAQLSKEKYFKFDAKSPHLGLMLSATATPRFGRLRRFYPGEKRSNETLHCKDAVGISNLCVEKTYVDVVKAFL